jgi:uncharacterized protein (UPF0332 family)
VKREVIELIKYRLEKASTTLADARLYHASASATSTVNRIYYALFYAVNALLMTKSLFSSKHSGVRALFNAEFVKTGIIDKEMGRFFSDMNDNRQEGDYKDFVDFDRDEVALWLAKADDFIQTIKAVTAKDIS